MPCGSCKRCPVAALKARLCSAAPEGKVADLERRLAGALEPASDALKLLLAGAYLKSWLGLAADVALSLLVIALALVLPHNLLFNASFLYLLAFLGSTVYVRFLSGFVSRAVARAEGVDELYSGALHTAAVLAAGCCESCRAACREAGERAERAAGAGKMGGLFQSLRAAAQRPHVRLAAVCLVVLPLSLLVSLKALVVAAVVLLDGAAVVRYLRVSGTLDKVAGEVKKQAAKGVAVAKTKVSEGKQKLAEKQAARRAEKPAGQPAGEGPAEPVGEPAGEPGPEPEGRESDGSEGPEEREADEMDIPVVSSTSPV